MLKRIQLQAIACLSFLLLPLKCLPALCYEDGILGLRLWRDPVSGSVLNRIQHRLSPVCIFIFALKCLPALRAKNKKSNHFHGWILLVGVAGFEPATSASQTRRDNRATLHPELVINFLSSHTDSGGETGIRTLGTLVRVRRFSKPLLSATQAPLLNFKFLGCLLEHPIIAAANVLLQFMERNFFKYFLDHFSRPFSFWILYSQMIDIGKFLF